MEQEPQRDREPETSGAQQWKLVLAYDGTGFHGWQVQPGRPTVQGTLQAALKQITGEHVLPQGSGRTDAGVHALGQVASFALQAHIPAANLQRALNRALPRSIRVLSAEPAAADFHARHSARGKLYEYRVHTSEICSPLAARYVYSCPWPLDLARLNTAAECVVGEHDFRSFAASDPEQAARHAESSQLQHTACAVASASSATIRHITQSHWIQENELLVYRVYGDGFLHHMVRNLVGTMIEAGRGRLEPHAMAEILAARDRAAAGPTAPACGLFLVRVDYPVAPA